MAPLATSRRAFLISLAAAMHLPGEPLPRIGHRQAQMTPQPTLDIFDLARRIGLNGVELQVFMKDYSLLDRDTAAAYKRASDRAAIPVPSLSGIWPKGQSLIQTATAPASLRQAIAAAGFFGSRVILVASFQKNCPNMDDESSYGPVVEMLQRVAPAARDAGVVLGLENSLSAAGNKKLIGLVNHPNVRVYWDFDNLEFYGHTGESVTGVAALGKDLICQVHCKNGDRLLEEPGRVDWPKALAALKAIGYDGWYFFETKHSSQQQCIEATRRNIAFIRRAMA